MDTIRHLRETLAMVVTQESLRRDVYAKNIGSAMGVFSPDYFTNVLQRQTDNYINSLQFLDDDANEQLVSTADDDLDEFDIADISPQEINKVTSSGMSWTDAVKQLKLTASNMKQSNQQNIINQM